MELIIKDIHHLPDIEFNFEELREELESAVKKYSTIIYTDKTIKEAKSDRAKLNKLADAINSRRIQVKKEYMQAYLDFEEKIKQLLTLLEKPIIAIDQQIKSYEQTEKQDKKEKIYTVFEQIFADVPYSVSYDVVFDAKWMNRSYSIADIEQEIIQAAKDIKTNLSMLNMFGEIYRLPCIAAYLKRLRVSDALEEKEQLERIYREDSRIDESRKKKTSVLRLQIEGTEQQLKALKLFLKAQHIMYGKAEDTDGSRK